MESDTSRGSVQCAHGASNRISWNCFVALLSVEGFARAKSFILFSADVNLVSEFTQIYPAPDHCLLQTVNNWYISFIHVYLLCAIVEAESNQLNFIF